MGRGHIYERSVAEQFEAFAAAVGDEVPLYTIIGRAVVEDQDLLDLAGLAMPGQPPPNMLFGAVQFLLLGGVEHELADWYPAISGSPPPGADPVPAFRDFCSTYRDTLAHLIATRRTQTNEVARCVALVPALAAAHRRAGEPLALVEVGASGGLLLAFDRYHYTFGRETWGPADARVRLTTELRGQRPPLPTGLDVVSRVGIDLYPLDLADEEDARWLDALVWPGHEERRRRLRAAVGLVAGDPPGLIAGDALEVLPDLLASLPRHVVPVVYHSFVLIQWTHEQRSALDELLRGAGRPVLRIWLEWFGYERNRPLIRLFDYRDGIDSVETLGRFHHHGRWLDWGWREAASTGSRS